MVSARDSSLVVKIASMCHEANRALCIAAGDDSQRPWAQATQEIQQSAIDGVVFIMENPEGPLDQLHNNWMEGKVRNGWRYGPVKNLEEKLHPSMLPYDELSPQERTKDAVFKAIVIGQTEGLRNFALRSEKNVSIDYTNHKGENAHRIVRPLNIYFGSTSWYPEAQWLVECYDFSKNAIRTFAIAKIENWKTI